MNADSFIYSKEPYYQEKIFELFGFSHSLIKKTKSIQKFSRGAILEKHKELKGKVGSKTKLELEDYLRNDLVENYLKIYKNDFNLDYFHFVSGADEINMGVSTGSLDIKVIFPTGTFLSGVEYLAIECKRINKELSKKKYYIDHGLNRFITRKYYPHSTNQVAWMLSFMESKNNSHREEPLLIVRSFNKLLKENYNESTIKMIGEKELDIKVDPKMNVFNSLFMRNDGTKIKVYHLFLDYYDLIDL